MLLLNRSTSSPRWTATTGGCSIGLPHPTSRNRSARMHLRAGQARGEAHMSIMMPASDQAVLARRDDIVAALRAIVPGEGVIDSAAEMLPYESDGLMAYRQPPMVVVLP